MYKTRVLIISKRKEQAVKYKKLIEALNQHVVITNDLSESFSIIQKQESEFIIISDTIKEKLSNFIKKIRALTYNIRPIIIAVSKSGDLSDKLETLDSGADDFLGEEISKQEFQTRFKAHLRRYIESSINQITQLPDKKLTVKAVKKTFDMSENLSYLLLKIENIAQYVKMHGEIAYEKVIQTLAAISTSAISREDFIGHITDDELLLIVPTICVENIASFLTFAFDNVLNKFYSNAEFENNFTLQSGDLTQESKTGLIRLHIASVEKSDNNNTYKNIINNLYELIKLCKDSPNSVYVVDRIKLNGEVTTKQKKNKVLILEPDISLSYLLKNVCELNDIDIKIVFNSVEFKEVYKEFSPDVVLLDWGSKDETTSLELAKNVSNDKIKLIFTSSFLNKKEILKAGADLYIPKPYEIDDVINWIKKFLNS